MRSKLRIRLVIAAIATALALACVPALAIAAPAAIVVTTRGDFMYDDGQCSLREAVRAANLDQAVGGCAAGSGNDSVNVPPGRYRLNWNLTQGENGGVTGDLDIWTRMTIRGTSQAPSIIDGNGTDRVFHIIAGGRATFDRLTITGGNTAPTNTLNPANPNPARMGGGIANHGNMTLIDSLVTGNQTVLGGQGGGVYNSGMVTIRDSWVTDNFADSGGGIYSSGSAYLIRTHVEDNTASGFASGPPRNPGPGEGDGPFAGGAGGITSTGYLNVLRSVIANNTGQDEWGHGGVAMVGGVIRDSLIEGNRTFICGTGGISMVKAQLIGSTVTDNSNDNCGPAAGGVYAVDSEVINSTISGNQANMAVAGIKAEGGSIVTSTITGNSTLYQASGLYIGPGGLDASAGTVVRNTIIAGNLGSIDVGQGNYLPFPDCVGTVISGGHNLIGDTSGCTFVEQPTDLLNVDPRLGSLANNGGFTPTHTIRPGSPAIDAWFDGSPGAGGTCPRYDQRGVHRPQDGDGDGVARCDIGALERTQ